MASIKGDWMIYVDFTSLIGQFPRLLIGRILVLLNSDWLRSIREKVKLACLVVKETTASLAGIIAVETLSPRWNPRTNLQEYLLLIIIHAARYKVWGSFDKLENNTFKIEFFWKQITHDLISADPRSSFKLSSYSKVAKTFFKLSRVTSIFLE